MNERIRELLIQSEVFNKDGTVLKDVCGYELNKFAELLIKECYEHCKGQMLDKEVADTNELTYNDAVMDCSNGLLQHFGVEE